MILSILLFMATVATMNDELTMLSLGDSYTIGESVAEQSRWPVQLVEQLQKKNIRFAKPQIIATTGWTTDELKEAISKSDVKKQYDWVTLLIGVNNQYRGRDAEQFREEFRELLKYAIEKSGNRPKRVLVLSIPDWGVTPFAKGRDQKKIAGEIDLYNKVKQEESQRAGVNFVDITDISREAVDPALGLIAEDGLHPSAKMYLRWVERALPMVEKELASGS